MTRSDIVIILLLIGTALVAVYVWPTRYRMIDTTVETEHTDAQMRVDRITGRIDQRQSDGSWVEYHTPPEYDVKYDSYTGRAVNQARQAGDDIKKMHEVAKEAMEH